MEDAVARIGHRIGVACAPIDGRDVDLTDVPGSLFVRSRLAVYHKRDVDTRPLTKLVGERIALDGKDRLVLCERDLQV